MEEENGELLSRYDRGYLVGMLRSHIERGEKELRKYRKEFPNGLLREVLENGIAREKSIVRKLEDSLR